MQVHLSPALAEIVNEQLALGYADPDTVITATLQGLAEENQHKLDRLRAELVKGEASGASRPYHLTELLTEADVEYERGEVEAEHFQSTETSLF